MTEIGVYQAKTHLARLLERVRRGESFVITKHGMPVAQLVAVAERDIAFVLHSSAALAMLIVDDRSAQADGLAEVLVRSSAQVPAIWPMEVRNALLAALRDERLTPREFEERLRMLDELPIEVDPGSDTEALARTLDIARQLDLSAGDASYLELARRRGIPLATFDVRLRTAGESLRIPVLPGRVAEEAGLL